MSNAAISKRNTSNSAFFEDHERRSSLLCHPTGLDILEYYFKMKRDGLDEKNVEETQELLKEKNMVITKCPDHTLCEEIFKALKPKLRDKETEISSAVVNAIEKEWSHSRNGSVKGEQQEQVSGILDDSPASGRPDCVVRLAFEQEGKTLPVRLVIEFSVDGNGGEKKIGQACDYASLSKGLENTALLLTFHLELDKEKDDGMLKIVQEVFLYVHNKDEKKRKVCFLWREIYKQKEGSDWDFLEKSCEGLVRCMNCVVRHRDHKEINESTGWKQVSDNVAIHDHDVDDKDDEDGKKRTKIKVVYKIFDNRFRPTYRRPDQWNENLPWVQKLEAKVDIFQESDDNLDKIGHPSEYAPNGRSKKRKMGDAITEYPRGSVCIIRYKFVNGTHYASRARHFLDIAKCIKEMHEKDVVHGDIRGFNMLHPHPPEDKGIENGIPESLLIDFDLSGKAGEDKYPPGYSLEVTDALPRKTEGKVLEKSDDWKNLGAVMACYEVSETNQMDMNEYRESKQEWVKIWESFYENGNKNDVGYNLLENFDKNHGNAVIRMVYYVRMQIGNG